MKIPQFNYRLIFSGDTVVLIMSGLAFLAAVANVTGWAALERFRFCGMLTVLVSGTFFLFTCVELVNYERQKRTIVAAILFLATIMISLGTGIHVIKVAN